MMMRNTPALQDPLFESTPEYGDICGDTIYLFVLNKVYNALFIVCIFEQLLCELVCVLVVHAEQSPATSTLMMR